MLDLISIGDGRIDNLYRLDDATLFCKKDSKECRLCLPYGEKLPVGNFQQFVAGNNANNAVGASRLGLKVGMYGHVGIDPNGEHIIAVLKKEGVETKYIKKVAGMDTENSAVISFEGDRTILVFHQAWEYDLPDLEKSRWVYFGSVSYSFSKSPIIGQIENYLERTGAKLMFAPGTHVLKHGVRKYPRLLSLATVVILNLEEAKVLLGIDGDKKAEVKKLLKGLVDLGPEVAVITDGENGSFAFDGSDFYKMGLFPAKVFEMTGSGDAYASGLLAGLTFGESLAEAMRWGAANSAAVVEQDGPQAGLLTLPKIREKLKEQGHILAEEF